MVHHKSYQNQYYQLISYHVRSNLNLLMMMVQMMVVVYHVHLIPNLVVLLVLFLGQAYDLI